MFYKSSVAQFCGHPCNISGEATAPHYGKEHRDPKSCLVAELCFHCFVYFVCVLRYVDLI